MILARIFPQTQNVGIELEDRLRAIAKLRARHYKYENAQSLLSPNADELPPALGKFDFVVRSAVFEHLLPSEHKPLVRQIWELLNPGGTLFLNQTPNRCFPVETHTTGLPLINYMPDRLAFKYARLPRETESAMGTGAGKLRNGIRGATIREIVTIAGSPEPNQEAVSCRDPLDQGVERYHPRAVFITRDREAGIAIYTGRDSVVASQMPAPISTTPVLSDACEHAPPDRGARLRRRGVEGNWPDSHRVKRFVRGLESSCPARRTRPAARSLLSLALQEAFGSYAISICTRY